MKEELRKQNYIKPKLDVIPVYENQVLGMNSSVTDRVVNNPQLSREVELMEDEEEPSYSKWHNPNTFIHLFEVRLIIRTMGIVFICLSSGKYLFAMNKRFFIHRYFINQLILFL